MEEHSPWEREAVGSGPTSLTQINIENVIQRLECQFSKLDVVGSNPIILSYGRLA